MSSEGSDTELQSTPPKKVTKKTPKSISEDLLQTKEEPKKMTTKDMINQALIDLKSRKGTSLHAIKKYIQEKYNVDLEKINYLIKKSIKTGVETGVIVQTKGVGASGSFKLAPGTVKPEKPKEERKKEPKKTVEKPTKPPKPANAKKKKESKPNEKNEEQKLKKKKEMSTSATSGKKKTENKNDSEKPVIDETKMKKKSKAVKMAKGSQTPAKKKSAMMKRKSIGSIIKPPKMNPKRG